MNEQERQLAEAVRKACLHAAQNAYEDGGFQGLCEAGRWELALDAIRSLNLAALNPPGPPQTDGQKSP